MLGNDDEGSPEPPGPVEMAIILALFTTFFVGVFAAVIQRF